MEWTDIQITVPQRYAETAVEFRKEARNALSRAVHPGETKQRKMSIFVQNNGCKRGGFLA